MTLQHLYALRNLYLVYMSSDHGTQSKINAWCRNFEIWEGFHCFYVIGYEKNTKRQKNVSQAFTLKRCVSTVSLIRKLLYKTVIRHWKNLYI